MKNLTILTQGYKDTLEEFILQKGILKSGGLYELVCPKNNLDTDSLAYLLEYIVIQEHPVYRHSPKLTDIALDLPHTKLHKANRLVLKRYLEENDLLHLEGYAAFRMTEYRNHLDIIMYGFIKKLKLTDSLL